MDMIVMTDLLKIIQQRQSTRVPFDRNHPVAKENLRQIIEAARWAPTPHNMQNFEILVVDDKELLERIGNIKSRVSEAFIRENYQQLSFSEEELLQKKVGILGTVFPSDWRDPTRLDKAVRESRPSPLNQRIRGSPVLLIVVYDARKRAPASEGDVLGIMSLGCVMENMWLMAQSLGISVQVLSVFSANPVEKEVKRILNVPEYMKTAFVFRLGYPVSAPVKSLRVRRDSEAFTHQGLFGNKGLG
ncbi:MAG: nitroreductase family protein [Candidatus Bathyarchaeia archaeon]|jgi:nitroreductase